MENLFQYNPGANVAYNDYNRHGEINVVKVTNGGNVGKLAEILA